MDDARKRVESHTIARPVAPRDGLARPHRGSLALMRFFYWTMGVLIIGTLAPAAFNFLLFLFSGEDRPLERARTLWAFTRLFTMAAVNLLIWGHVVVGLWRLWF